MSLSVTNRAVEHNVAAFSELCCTLAGKARQRLVLQIATNNAGDGECVMREGYACGGEGVGMMTCGVCGMFILKCVCVYACMYTCICCMYVCW